MIHFCLLNNLIRMIQYLFHTDVSESVVILLMVEYSNSTMHASGRLFGSYLSSLLLIAII